MQLNMLEAMNIYVNVVEQGSFIRAAEVLELHRPAVTRAVQNLEHDLGVKLLHRTTRQVSMTDEGEEFYQRCLSLLSELDDVRRLFSRTQPPKGRLRLDVPITLARAVIIPALGDFQNRYPDIEIVLGTSDRKIDLIAERVDCVIRLGELNDSSFVARRLGTAAMVTCAAPSYLAKHGTPHSIDELMKSHRAVNFFSNHSLQIMEWKFTVDGSIASIKIPSSILVDNSEAFLSCGLAGLGVLHGLRPSLAPFIASGELTEILTDFPPPPKPVSLLYPDRQYLAPKVRVFIDWLCKVCCIHGRCINRDGITRH
ncbi:LysR family transcriptional regulator [Salmonella enterica]|nr:LysR family transcriptional regulator [Salmonella enterica]